MATTGKAALRAQLQAARRRVADHVRAEESRMLSGRLEAAESILSSGDTVCAYVPVGAEPGSIDMLDVLLRRSGRVLLPVARTDTAGGALPLRWGEYRPGTLTSARWGLLEPPEPWLPAAAIAGASLILVPSLAVDRSGVRLGRGRGFYDRSLGDRDPHARLVAVVRDAELVDHLPAEPHDIPMTDALTPRGGLVALKLGNE